MSRRASYRPYLLMLPTLVLLVFFVVYPLGYSIVLSVTNYNMFSMHPTMNFIGADNFLYFLIGDGSRLFWTNTLPITTIVTLFSLAVELLIGFGLSLLLSEELRGLRFFRALFMIPMLMPGVSVAFIWANMYQPTGGVLNYALSLFKIPPLEWVSSPATAQLSVILVDIWQWTPFMFLVILAGLSSLPTEPFEAASADGATSWQKLRMLTIPMVRPVVLIAVLLRTVDLLKNLDVLLVLNPPAQSAESISFHIYRLAWSYGLMSEAAAEAFIVLLLANIIAFLFIREMGVTTTQ
jgi:multiple sugar transport system permease protein